jgi:AcrR family transcriptional regulator
MRGQAILSATLEQLAVVGYRALSVEEIAAKAGVNKTTIYRRWPTKKELVHAALASFACEAAVVADTGTLRGDLLAVARGFVAFASSIVGQGIFRVIALDTAEPELATICEAIRADKEANLVAVVARAIERGEMRKTCDARLLHQMLLGPLHLKLFRNERIDDVFLTRVIDVLLTGVLLPARPSKPTRAPARRRARSATISR